MITDEWRTIGPPEIGRFSGFGPFRLMGRFRPPGEILDLPPHGREARRVLRQAVGDCPGVYGMIDAAGELIYVGKSKRLASRLMSYLAARPADPKAARIIRRTRRLVIEPAPHELTALLRELELIRRFQPWFNRRGKSRQDRLGYVCVGDAPAGCVYLARHPLEKTDAVFGPLRWTGRLVRAVRRLNDHFQLRDCPPHVRGRALNAGDVFSLPAVPLCPRHDLGTCLAPCAAAHPAGRYARRLTEVRDFLAGHSDAPLAQVEAKMAAAAASCRYELAALLRNAWLDLRFVREQLHGLAAARHRYSFIYPLPGYGRNPLWLVIRHGCPVTMVPAPRGEKQRQKRLGAVGELLAPAASGEAAAGEDYESLTLVSAWFRHHREELARTISPQCVRETCPPLSREEPPCR